MENKNIKKNVPIRDTPFTKRQLSRADVVDIIIDLQQIQESIDKTIKKLYSLDDEWTIIPDTSFLEEEEQ